ncbi:SGNH/GDSL hydrolase family protein [Rubinisphaera brasiliensis]|uniref:SGNH hydrolase-type esterase domain-containing protein n=1 Tax=Rubinisphaera brasiliensis (strain ATCC 49424 / DSM 5305 / JCM 21570 / IAM 15109 / NBRC 103401 / IFAM 1448) TaxID=756272 RepID=F0SGY7_RUBBR|nr:SGNH/GDSL hydrolase family protein [Rubinisphaera brasiliensis]ADY59472.1 hypothetical protein Plabr_1862 [Rubinisphaera brasiliensis DSM 5305]
MRNSARQFHQRMGAHNRRRRLMLSSYSHAAAPSLEEEELNEQVLLDPVVVKTVNATADYLSQKEGEVDSLVGAASNLIRGRSTTGSALLADFPEVECEVLPEDQQKQKPRTDDDPESVFSDIGEDDSSEEEPARDAKPREASKPRVATADMKAFSREPMGATNGMNQVRGWLHGHEPRVWMFLGDETTAWMRYQHEPGYAEMFRHRLRWELRRFPDLIVNAGIESATVDELLKVADQGLRQCRADAVFVLPGPADAASAMQRPSAYAQKLLELATVIRKQNAAPVFQTPPIPFAEQQTEYGQQLVHLADVIRETCIVREIPVIDHAEFWLEQPPCPSWYNAETRTLTTNGQSALGLLFFSELDLFDRSSQLCTRLQEAWHDGPADEPPQIERVADAPKTSETRKQ